jgi:beta-xylosidase
MTKYYLDVITSGTNFNGREAYIIEAQHLNTSTHGYYYFYNSRSDLNGVMIYEPIAYFPIDRTIISKIENL